MTLSYAEALVNGLLLPCADSARTSPLQTGAPSELSLQLLLTLPYAVLIKDF